MANYHAGRRKEWQARRYFGKHAQLTTRAAGSKGLVDVIAVYQKTVYLVQVKYVKPKAAWRDANWRTLIALTVPPNVHRIACVYRRGQRDPELHYAWQDAMTAPQITRRIHGAKKGSAS